ncbi:MAG: hypothetical protein ACRD3E_08415 [Terriglobales bacterium]
MTPSAGSSQYYQGPGPTNVENAMILCPECESDIDVEEDEVEEGEIVSCPECGTDFEVVTADPLELTRVAEEDEEEVEEKEEQEKGEDGDY